MAEPGATIANISVTAPFAAFLDRKTLVTCTSPPRIYWGWLADVSGDASQDGDVPAYHYNSEDISSVGRTGVRDQGRYRQAPTRMI